MRLHTHRLLTIPGWATARRVVAVFTGRRRPAGQLQAQICLLALAAFLLSAVPLDHIVAHGQEAGTEHVHEMHCHGASGDCSDAPVSAGPGQFLLSDPLLVVPSLLAVLVLVLQPAMLGVPTRPRLRPPLVAS